MKFRYSFFIFFSMLGCKPRNPYYLVHLPHRGSEVYFEAKLGHLDYRLTGESVISENTIKCKIPDSLGGAYITGGDCIVDILMDNSAATIKRIDIISLYFYDSQQKATRGFDIYNTTNKRIGKPNNKDCKRYISFVRDFVSKLSFKRVTTVESSESHAYCRLLFHLIPTQSEW